MIVTVINPLSKDARKTFQSDWDDYYEIRIGWFKWFKVINLGYERAYKEKG